MTRVDAETGQYRRNEEELRLLGYILRSVDALTGVNVGCQLPITIYDKL